eukprot:scaffold27.g6009.t1
MFWRVSGLNTASPVDSILDKDSFTLEELLDEDELIQECKSLNARLNNYLKERNTVEKLLRYLVEPPPPGCEDPKPRFKYPFAACEIFCCEVEGIFNTLLENDDLLSQLFSILQARAAGTRSQRGRVPTFAQPTCVPAAASQSSRPMNCMLAGYFSRRHRELLDLMAEHVDTTSIAEVLVRLVGADDQRAFMPNSHMQANAAEILAAVAQSQGSPLTRGLTSPDFLELLCARALAPSPSAAATHALNVCVALLDPLPSMPGAASGGVDIGGGGDMGGGMQPDPAVLETQEVLRAETIRCMSRSIHALVALLEAAPVIAELHTTYGLLRPPVEAAVMSTRGVQLSMDLLLAAPFNNALHRHVAQLVTAFEVCSADVTRFLLHDCRLLDWLVANRLLRAAGEGGNPALAEALKSHEGWQRFLSEVLEPRNTLESVFSWQCGRPSLHEPGIEGEMFQTELDFGSMDSEAFSRDVYQRYGVYENEDEEVETETPAWAVDLATTGVAEGGRGGGGSLLQPGKLQQRAPVPESWDSSSSSSSGSDDEGEGLRQQLAGAPIACRDSEEEQGLSIAPAPDGDIVIVSSSADKAQPQQQAPPSGSASMPGGALDDSDMMDDAVMLDSEFEAAEQLVELQQHLEQGLNLGEEGSSSAGARDGYEQTCTFSSYANWLLPGALLVGRYPYVESSRCTDPIQGEAQLRALLEAGVRVFVSLQQELPEQGAIKIGGVGGFLPYKATAQLIASAMSDPPSLEEVAALRTPELDRFLPPRRSGRPNLSSTRHRLELEFLHCPVPDLGLPQEAALEALIADDIAPRLRAAVAHGGEGAVYLHCWGGRGRVGTAAACLLAQLYGVSAEEALERVQRAFDTRRDEARRSPETTEQLEFVRKYIAARQ